MPQAGGERIAFPCFAHLEKQRVRNRGTKPPPGRRKPRQGDGNADAGNAHDVP
jgi:hypothetical protein